MHLPGRDSRRHLRRAPLDSQPLRQALARGLSKDALIERALKDEFVSPV